MNKVEALFKRKFRDILNIYFTAGHPSLKSIEEIIVNLEKAGVDLVEIGIPYSDPLADGPTIQESGSKALKNRFTLDYLFQSLEMVRSKVSIPFILMGYFNPILQYGEDRFFAACQKAGVDGLIIPDMPLDEFKNIYQQRLKDHNLVISFLVTPQTSDARIRKIDELTTGFIYVVSSSSITGAKSSISDTQITYFNRIQNLRLHNPTLIGFGISNYETYHQACKYANGAIVGSAFIKALEQNNHNLGNTISSFVQKIRNK